MCRGIDVPSAVNPGQCRSLIPIAAATRSVPELGSVRAPPLYGSARRRDALSMEPRRLRLPARHQLLYGARRLAEDDRFGLPGW